MLRIILIDDEPHCIAILKAYLDSYRHLPLKVVGTAHAVNEAVNLIDEKKPDLILLDIKIKGGYGFDVLEKVSFQAFKIIFTTAYNDYAIQAFDFATIHYLLKPIVEEDLHKAIEKYQNQISLQQAHYQCLKESIDAGEITKIGIPSSRDTLFIAIESIVYLEADMGYTLIHTTDYSKKVSTKTLKYYENLLRHRKKFYRIHHKYIINMEYINKYIKGVGGQVIMSNEHQLDVSKRRKKDFLQLLQELTNL